MTQQEPTNSEINLNSADVETLVTVPGISDELAERIVAHRQEQPFETVDDVKAVEGVSEELFDQIKTAVVAGVDAPVDEASDTPAGEPDEAVAVEAAEASKPVDSAAAATELEEAPKPVETDIVDDAGEPALEESTPLPEPDEAEGPAESGGYLITWPNEGTESAGQQEDKPESKPQSRAGAADNFRRPWLLMLVGALLGTFVSLGALYVVNDGVLVFANHPKVTQLETALSNLEQREATLNERIETLQNELTQLGGLKERVDTHQTQLRELRQAEESLSEQFTLLDERSTDLEDRAATVEERVSTMGKDVTSLQVATNRLNDALAEVEEDTARFDGFLDGLRELLIAAQE